MVEAAINTASTVSGTGREAIHIQVCHALPDEALIEALTVKAGTTIAEALSSSGLGQRMPELLAAVSRGDTKVGIFGKVKTPDTVLRDGDRIEVYRPLQADPKDTRRRRAKHKEQATGR